jgi:hypothetical protein
VSVPSRISDCSARAKALEVIEQRQQRMACFPIHRTKALPAQTHVPSRQGSTAGSHNGTRIATILGLLTSNHSWKSRDKSTRKKPGVSGKIEVLGDRGKSLPTWSFQR